MIPKTIGNFWQDILDFVYPPRCPVCQRPLSGGRGLLCESCVTAFQAKRKLFGPYCPFCKSELHPSSESCGCGSAKRDLEAVFSLGTYSEEMEALIENFKYRRKKRLGLFLSEALSQALSESSEFPGADWIVAVPLHKRKLRERGFNQSEAIAAQLSEKLRVPILSNSIIRKRNTRTQTGLSREERQKNVKGAFECRGRLNLGGKKLLLIDDVLTTGATMSECASTLKSAGAEKIWGVSLAVASGTGTELL